MPRVSDDLADLDFGYIYFVKGRLSQVRFELHQCANVHYHHIRDEAALYDYSELGWEAEERETHVFVLDNYEQIDIREISPDVRFFIICMQPNGEFFTHAEQHYKKNCSGIRVACNIEKKSYRNKTEIASRLERFDIEQREAIYSKYKRFPLALIAKLDSGEYAREVELPDKAMSAARKLIFALLEDNWYTVWKDYIQDQGLYPTFWIPGSPDKSRFYRSLTGLNTSYDSNGMCPALWVFLEYAMSSHESYPEHLRMVYSFATWVRASSSILTTPGHGGLREWRSNEGKYRGVNFEPSPRAVAYFFEKVCPTARSNSFSNSFSI